jgi:D-alanine-D-alanine ligase
VKVLILHTTPPQAPGEDRVEDEFDLSEAASNVAAALPEATICGIRGDAREILALLDLHLPAVVFNLCEAPLGRPDLEAHVAALMEWLGMRFTGCGSETLALCRRKDLVNPVLSSAGIPVPAAIDPARPSFPCIVKPSAEDGSAGLSHNSVCENPAELARAMAHLEGPAVIQEFLPGREFVISLWGRCQPDFVSIGETVFEKGLRLITYAAKWHVESEDFANSPLFYNSKIAPRLQEAIIATACGAWRAVRARHALRVDVRLDEAGNPRVLDVNPNPEISPGVGICRGVQEAGWQWQDFIHNLVEWA